MKLISRIGVLCLVACTLNILAISYPATAQSSGYQQPGDTPPDIDEMGVEMSTEAFEDELSPYGEWIDTPEYGRVWIPDVDKDFKPYATNGHWVVTKYGNTWVSNYEWGWAAFHYGRWYYHKQYGWAWVPGRIWGPAWVSWRSGGGYYGWAPLGPSVTININLPLYSWIFVRQEYITSPVVYNHYVYINNTTTVYQNTTVIRNNYRVNNRTYVYGPKRQEIATVTNRPVTVYSVNHGNRGRSVVNGNSVSIYRPTVDNQRRNSVVNNSGQPNTGNSSSTTRRRRYQQSTNNQGVTPTDGRTDRQDTATGASGSSSSGRRRNQGQIPASGGSPSANVEQQTPSGGNQTTRRRRSEQQYPVTNSGSSAPESSRERTTAPVSRRTERQETPSSGNSGGSSEPESRRTERQESGGNSGGSPAPESRRDSDSGNGRRSDDDSDGRRGRSR
jgi:hypothetical protein